MAYPFSEEEKRLILAEVIKTSNLDLGHLVDFLKLHKTEPNWLKMQLPPGRTMEQCIQVTEQMFQGPMRIPDLKRKPVGDLLDKPSKRLAVASPMEPPAQLPPLASASQGPSAYANLMSSDAPPTFYASGSSTCTSQFSWGKSQHPGRELSLQFITRPNLGDNWRAPKEETRAT
ncbi:hypothetical protein K4K57_002897 [Colletotrichum sp. SAR 10_99]|nr:hypothetical protein K4K57_002897 [Colletotrichum sp. SAR 10_99]